MAKWTREQDEVLIEYAHLGLDECRSKLFELCDVLRSPEAIKRHGNRIGASFRQYRRCEECGGLFTPDHIRKGLCRDCSMKVLIERQRRQLENAAENSRKDGSPDLKRKYDALRKRKSRERKKDPEKQMCIFR